MWAVLVIFVFLTMLSSAVIMLFVAVVLIRLGLLSLVGHPVIPVFLLLNSVAIGTGITAIVGKKILRPIIDVSNATKEVAKGNFKVTLDERHKIDEINKMAKNFNIMVQELAGIETLRNDFVVNVSHEFKTPIAAIEGYAVLLKDRTLSDAEHNDYIRMITESAQKLSALTSNILKLSKLENQELITEKNSFRLDEQIRQALLLLEVQWNNKNITLNLELEPLIFYGNEELMMQIWLNLLGNAIKFTDAEGEISISLHAAGQYVTVRISDTGIGMSREVQKHIFEKFYQGDNARASEGNGLGLPLVKRIVDLCGGFIEVESQPGEGSSFTVRLPRAAK